MWQPDKKNKLGLLALASNSFLLEITAKTFFGGYDILNSQEGILTVLKKIAELKPNVKLWYRDEGQFQQALQSGEIPMGQYYHDVAGLAAAERVFGLIDRKPAVKAPASPSPFPRCRRGRGESIRRASILLSRRLVQSLHILFGQLHVRRRQELLQLRHRVRADDR